MSCRLRRAVAGLIVIAAAIPAAESTIEVHSPRGGQTLVLALDELHVEGAGAKAPADPRRADARVAMVAYHRGGSARATLQQVGSAAELVAVARRISSSSVATTVSAVAYPSGSKDPAKRVLIGKRITLGYTGDANALAERHGCRVERMLAPGVWLLTATDDDPLAALAAAPALAGESGVSFAEAQLRLPVRPLRTTNDPLLDAYPVPTPYYPPWWQANAPPLDPTVPAWSLTSAPQQWPPANAWVTNPPYAVVPPGRHLAAVPAGVSPVLLPPIGPIPPPDDVAHGLAQPLGTPPVPGSPGYYWTLDPLPNQPFLLNGPDHGQWHLLNTIGGMNCKPAWSEYTGNNVAVTVVDTGLEYTHPDLGIYPTVADGRIGNVLITLQHNIVTPGTTVLPVDPLDQDSHSTCVSGVIAAKADNGIGGVGVAFDAKIIPVKFLQSFDDRPGHYPDYIAYRDDADYADAAGWCLKGTGPLDTTAINTNSWGIDGFQSFGPTAGSTAVLQNAMTYGRFGRGIVYTFATANDFMTPEGPFNTLHPYNHCGVSGFINRYTIGVGALNRTGNKATYSEIGQNMLICAPGGENSPVIGWGGIVTTDRVGINGYDIGVPNFWQQFINYATLPNIWDGDYTLVHPYNDPWCNLYGQGELCGTSFATPNAAGVIALMLEARPQLTWRDVQSVLVRRARKPNPSPANNANPTAPVDYTLLLNPTVPGDIVDNRDASDNPIPPYYGPGLFYGVWRQNAGGAVPALPSPPNANGLTYNLWYGYGAIDAVKAVYGMGTNPAYDAAPANANLSPQSALFRMRYDNPGALQAPLLPVEAIPLTASFVRDSAITDVTNNLSGFIPIPTGAQIGTGLPRLQETIVIDPLNSEPGFVTETVELHVKVNSVRQGNLTWALKSPNGTILQIPKRGDQWTDSSLDFTFTFQGFRDEDPHGKWRLIVVDTKGLNNYNGYLERADLTIHGHQPYPVPTVSGTSTTGVAAGTTTSVPFSGSGFATNASGEVCATTAAWFDNSVFGSPAVIYHLPVTFNTGALINVVVPSTAALASNSPGVATIQIGNPSLQWGQVVTPAAWYDAAMNDGNTGGLYCSDQWEPFNSAVTYTAPLAGEKQRLKWAGGATPYTFTCKYSRPPIITPIADIMLPAGTATGSAFPAVTFTVTDPDINGPLNPGRTGNEETLTIAPQVFNQSVVSQGSLILTPVGPTVRGTGTYTLSGTISGTSGLSLIQVGATDGVTTTYAAFRIGVLAKDSASGCGGGMGLALLGTPLAVWLLRRRRRN